MKVLLIEDNDTGRETLTYLLKHHDHKVEAYNNAEKGVERVLRDGIKFDRIISDMKLPGMNGLDFLQVLRRHQFGRTVKFIMISAYNFSTGPVEADLYTACLAEDAKFITKPFDAEKLIAYYIESWPLNNPKI